MATAASPYSVLLLTGCWFGTNLVDRVATDGFGALRGGVVLAVTLVLMLLGLGALAGAASVARQIRATRRLSDLVARHRIAPPAGTPGEIEVVDYDEPFAFTFGLGQPRVAVSRGLLEQLSTDELKAVVIHERYHVQAHDPLKLVVARAAARTCFFLPAVDHLVGRYLVARELAADRRSVRNVGRPALAGALFKAVAGPAWVELGIAAPMASPDLLVARVNQLEHGSEPVLPTVPRTALAASALVLTALGGIVTAVALQGDMSMMSTGRNGSLALENLTGAVAGGLACAAGWLWLAAAAFRRLGGRALTTTTKS